jgi:hypothetical protein
LFCSPDIYPSTVRWIPLLRLFAWSRSGCCLPVWVWRIVFLRSSNFCGFSAAPFRTLAIPSLWSLLLLNSTAVSYGFPPPFHHGRSPRDSLCSPAAGGLRAPSS